MASTVCVQTSYFWLWRERTTFCVSSVSSSSPTSLKPLRVLALRPLSGKTSVRNVNLLSLGVRNAVLLCLGHAACQMMKQKN